MSSGQDWVAPETLSLKIALEMVGASVLACTWSGPCWTTPNVPRCFTVPRTKVTSADLSTGLIAGRYRTLHGGNWPGVSFWREL